MQGGIIVQTGCQGWTVLYNVSNGVIIYTIVLSQKLPFFSL